MGGIFEEGRVGSAGCILDFGPQLAIQPPEFFRPPARSRRGRKVTVGELWELLRINAEFGLRFVDCLCQIGTRTLVANNTRPFRVATQFGKQVGNCFQQLIALGGRQRTDCLLDLACGAHGKSVLRRAAPRNKPITSSVSLVLAEGRGLSGEPRPARPPLRY